MNIRLDPCEVLRKGIQTTGRWTHTMLLSILARTTEGKMKKEPRDASECTAPCERLRDFCRSEKKTKTKTDGTKQLPTAPAARGNAIVRGLVSTY
ncbi:hypothetical protein ACRRTK_015082 [Alexandromys fortis]